MPPYRLFVMARPEGFEPRPLGSKAGPTRELRILGEKGEKLKSMKGREIR
jgi:hypothetical protein